MYLDLSVTAWTTLFTKAQLERAMRNKKGLKQWYWYPSYAPPRQLGETDRQTIKDLSSESSPYPMNRLGR